MAKHKVIRVWSVIVTALLAFFASLGLSSTAAATPAVPQEESSGNRTAEPAAQHTDRTAPVTLPAARAYDGSRPPTMKQRIRAEAHGSSPSSRTVNLPAAPLSDIHQVDKTKEADVLPPRPRPGNATALLGE
ncbi:DUF6344 domain-containing protein [Streptomyces sp. NPDC002851]